ncbi:MAG: hypothetical protein JJE52_17055 [Acidimicrobiia bacterium]|nr:hypothetical protein [Acidimicrobiia bacterium]
MTVSGWPVVFAVVAVVNPPRLAPALPGRGRPLRERLEPTVLGGIAASVVLIALAAAGEAVADLLSVSAPTLRVAAGLVVLLGAARDVLGGPPAAEPALSGRRAALVPVAVPFVLRPDLGLLVVSAGADGRVGLTVGAVVVAVATLVGAGAIAGSDEGGGRQMWAWAAACLHGVAVLSGVTLAVSGVLSV